MKKRLFFKTVSSFLIINLIFFSSHYWMWAGPINVDVYASSQEVETEGAVVNSEETEVAAADEEADENLEIEPEKESQKDDQEENEEKGEDQVDEEEQEQQPQDSSDPESETENSAESGEEDQATDDNKEIQTTAEEVQTIDKEQQTAETNTDDDETNDEAGSDADTTSTSSDENSDAGDDNQDESPIATESAELNQDSPESESDSNQTETTETKEGDLPDELTDQELISETSTTAASLDQEVENDEKEIEEETQNTLTTQNENEAEENTEEEPDNSAIIDTTVEGTSDSGHNTSQGEGEAEIETGDASSLANILNQANLELNRTILEVLFIEAGGDYQEDIDLNQLWTYLNELELTQTQLMDESDSNIAKIEQEMINDTSSLAIVDTDINLSANTGSNQLSSEENGTVLTGDATTLANLINLINLQINDSILLLGTININEDYTGNIILPRPEKLAQWLGDDFDFNSLEDLNLSSQPSIENSVEINQEINAVTNTGHNEQTNSTGDAVNHTGDADTTINSLNLLNNSYSLSGWYYLLLNNWDLWSGQSNLQADSLPWLVLGSPQANTNPNDQDPNPGSITQTTNQAEINTKINLEANTGNNQMQTGQGGTIETGDAKAGANLTNIVNSNFNQTRWFMSWINIMQSWNGNLIFAYPDLEVKLQATPISYNQDNSKVRYQIMLGQANLGHDSATNSRLNLDLPSQGKIISVSPSANNHSNRSLLWSTSSLATNQASFYEIIMEFDLPDNNDRVELSAKASTSTSDPELNRTNNQTSVKIILENIAAVQTDNDEGETLIELESDRNLKEPQLSLTAQNNVGSHVYLGDTIIFELSLQNQGAGDSYDTLVMHDLLDARGNLLGRISFDAGHIPAGRKLNLSFEFTVNGGSQLADGVYSTASQAFGAAENGEWFESNQALTNFRLVVPSSGGLIETSSSSNEQVQSEIPKRPQVLGVSDMNDDADTWLWYNWLILIVGLGLITLGSKIWVQQRRVLLGLNS